MEEKNSLQEFENMDLNPENVKKLFTYCVTDEKGEKRIQKEDEISQEVKLFQGETKTYPNVYFNMAKINSKMVQDSIQYLMGQLQAVHAKKPVMDINMARFKANGSTNGYLWANSENSMQLYELLYLAVGNKAINPLKEIESKKSPGKKIIGIDLTHGNARFLRPTYSEETYNKMQSVIETFEKKQAPTDPSGHGSR